eukprot:CAMPEP_0168594552 /NCGR_PEP_ID=MMETSP0420-20121227/8963_1 /TAXON_ID=498008 /ORGANISM="Pessonella sp." /LENGTH=75 /DNA_ID=CAMNT_0008630887 /DNA_START=22 /DNA_END=246 /DNA_ORIENTATION=+
MSKSLNNVDVDEEEYDDVDENSDFNEEIYLAFVSDEKNNEQNDNDNDDDQDDDDDESISTDISDVMNKIGGIPYW